MGAMLTRMRRTLAGAVATLALVGGTSNPSAETIQPALVKAYQNNPQLNAERAAVRATHEGVPQALSGYRPRVSSTGTLGEQYSNSITRSGGPTQISPPQPVTTYVNTAGTVTPWSVGITGQQTLYNGFQTANRTRAAESQVSAGREGLRVLEQT